MRRATLFALGWLVFTIGVLILHTGCGSATKPSTAKPETKQTDQVALTCFRVERGTSGEAYFCSTASLCESAHARTVAYWDVIETRYGATGLSDCLDVEVVFSDP